MDTTFENAPLVEIIAELHWDPTTDKKIDLSQPAFVLFDSDSEAYFTKFLTEIAENGYGMSERMVPPGAPQALFSPTYRIKKIADPSTLFQVGPGLFTANATPPYKSWTTFEPVVKVGVNKLLASRSGPQKDRPFRVVKLRYIDAFKPELTNGMSAEQFMNEILGFKFSIPAAIEYRPDSLNAHLQYKFMGKDGFTVRLTVADGKVAGDNALIMDTTLEMEGPVPPDSDQIMAILGRARRVIHDTFLQLTKPIEGRMRPKTGG
jgi:uncharacterized protein (TIGR04255 family)